MKKTDQAVEIFQEIIRNQCDEITALKEKAEAYDRLMSGGKHDVTMKELANILHMVIVANEDGQLVAFDRLPTKSDCGSWIAKDMNFMYWGIPLPYAIHIDDWTTSLTLPDGWEEK